MISVEDATRRILSACPLLPAETVSLSQAAGRVLATDVAARRMQPPCDVSAMDGYAVRAGDCAKVPVELKMVGEAPAGGLFQGELEAGTAVRIFTGGPVPPGADSIILQEDTEADGTRITVQEAPSYGQHIRRTGIDFAEGEVMLRAGRRLSPFDIGLLASMNVPWVRVQRRPRVALLATGDELVMPGETPGPAQVISSNSIALKALCASAGAETTDLGIAADNRTALASLAEGAAGHDVLVTIGGASVGDRDLVKQVLGEGGLDIDFWKIAMKPGKPLIFGQFQDALMLGLPGNPVSALVCALLYLAPALRRMQGIEDALPKTRTAVLGCDLPANKARQDYLRSKLVKQSDDALVATPYDVQDSSMLSKLSAAKALVIRPPEAPAAKAGDEVEVIPLTGFADSAF
ncbi:MAG: molybdopterin molybdotransferase MoeA [Alphaproteobacteria bacterium]|nr:molybdopterin molybdotransferase MoeA [Alphaproteobacteria bacterium]